MFNNLKFRNQMQCSLSQGRTQWMLSLIGLPVFSNQHLFRLTQDQKGFSKACNGLKCKVTTRYKEFTYCLCNFIMPQRSHTFMFIRLRALFKSSLVGIVDQLVDPPFGLVHLRLVLAFSIVVIWIIRRHSTALQNYSTTR
ncbi:hypothetical protein H5410_030661 [Solanum commersonii]|uniref:Uncharacterized protein n=1 Tax=Solanum commersonii TaxID=4109 RepID=A0A9J5YEX4_SOLCO|nr:hypothetical protein H5410_030661 [Solanum commersonii]